MSETPPPGEKPEILAPERLRADLDVYGYPLDAGCRVRIHARGFLTDDGRIVGLCTEGPYVDYIEGHLTGVGDTVESGYRRYTIRGDIVCDAGGTRRIDRLYDPPVNGTPTNLDRWTCAVVRVIAPVTRQDLAELAATVVRDSADGGLYRHDPHIPGDQDRAACLLRHDLERAFGFAGDAGIPQAILRKAFDIARRISFERCSRFVPRAIVEDYTELGEILAIAQTTPIRF